jgi:hypothetical protein
MSQKYIHGKIGKPISLARSNAMHTEGLDKTNRQTLTRSSYI